MKEKSIPTFKNNKDIDKFVFDNGVDPGLPADELKKQVVSKLGETAYLDISQQAQRIDSGESKEPEKEGVLSRIGKYDQEITRAVGRGGINTVKELYNYLGHDIAGLPETDLMKKPETDSEHPIAEGAGGVISTVALGPLLGGLSKSLALRLAGSELFGASQSRKNPILGAITGGALQGGSELALKSISPFTEKGAASYLLSKADKEFKNTKAGKGDLSNRSPEQVAQLMEGLPENFPVPLGTATGNQGLIDLEKSVASTPFSGFKGKMMPALHQVQEKSNFVVNDLLEGAKGDPAKVSEKISDYVVKAKDKVQKYFEKKYTELYGNAHEEGYTHRLQPNLIETAKKYLNQSASKGEHGVYSPPGASDLKAADESYLERIVSKEALESSSKNPASINIVFGKGSVESELKAKARDSTDIGTKKMYGDLAHAMRKDIEHNASPTLKSSIEKLNKQYEEKYIDVYKKPAIEKIISGEADNPSTLLLSNKNKELINDLPEEARKLIYFEKAFGRSVTKDPVTNLHTISPEKIASAYGKSGTAEGKLKDLLLPGDIKKEIDSLSKMSLLTRAQKVEAAKVPTGKESVPLLKVGGSVAAALHPKYLPYLLTGLTLGRSLSKGLTSRKTIDAYIKGKIPRSSLSHIGEQAPKAAIGAISAANPSNKEE